MLHRGDGRCPLLPASVGTYSPLASPARPRALPPRLPPPGPAATTPEGGRRGRSPGGGRVAPPPQRRPPATGSTAIRHQIEKEPYPSGATARAALPRAREPPARLPPPGPQRPQPRWPPSRPATRVDRPWGPRRAPARLPAKASLQSRSPIATALVAACRATDLVSDLENSKKKRGSYPRATDHLVLISKKKNGCALRTRSTG